LVEPFPELFGSLIVWRSLNEWLDERRTSAEVINATLLEVFLALVFVVFALAIFHQMRADAAEEELKGAGTITLTLSDAQDSLLALEGVTAKLTDSLREARETIARLKFESPYPPDCEPRANPPWVLTVTLTGPGQLTVAAHRPIGDVQTGESLRLTPASFRTRFEAVRTASLKQGCRYFVRVQDTPDMPKTEYKMAMAAISSIFRFRGAFQ
jgi:hypothetical protein